MTLQQRNSNRRHESREILDGCVRWRSTTNRRSRWAWLSNGSSDSVSFITETESVPVVGEEIELTEAGMKKQTYRVVRISPYDDVLAFVACRKNPRNKTERRSIDENRRETTDANQ